MTKTERVEYLERREQVLLRVIRDMETHLDGKFVVLELDGGSVAVRCDGVLVRYDVNDPGGPAVEL